MAQFRTSKLRSTYCCVLESRKCLYRKYSAPPEVIYTAKLVGMFSNGCLSLIQLVFKWNIFNCQKYEYSMSVYQKLFEHCSSWNFRRSKMLTEFIENMTKRAKRYRKGSAVEQWKWARGVRPRIKSWILLCLDHNPKYFPTGNRFLFARFSRFIYDLKNPTLNKIPNC